MRVISGVCKGRVLYSPKNNLIRPTSDRIKKFIFDYIGNSIQDSIILDIFCGSGNLSIEALSRGARFAVMVDRSIQAIRLSYRNAELTNFLSQCHIVRQDVARFLKRAVIEQKNKFDFIFADPPYFIESYQNIFRYIGSDSLLKNGGFFILEQSSRTTINAGQSGLFVEKTKTLGDTIITFYQNKETHFANRDLSGNI